MAEKSKKNPKGAGRKKVNYIDNENFKKLLADWLKDKDAKMSEELALYFKKMIDRISYKYNFRGYTNIEDMRQTAFLNILLYGKNFDSEKSNPFAYFSTMIFNEFIKMINKENKYKADNIKLLYDSTDDLSTLINYYNFDDIKG